ncbi:unnamed protein product [Moneuplotes crassus]|uniref:Uncharacterized protein n=1 Tax=Euplotes crassus TaxID=5936 RepID=A0AAD1X5G2_EUPCR|nr:unnamed protein product [Moneuplotes crassus]
MIFKKCTKKINDGGSGLPKWNMCLPGMMENQKETDLMSNEGILGKDPKSKSMKEPLVDGSHSREHVLDQQSLEAYANVEESNKPQSMINNEELKLSLPIKKGRGRPRMYQEPEFYVKTLRLDVNNKTLIRAAKREFVSMFRYFCVGSGVLPPLNAEGGNLQFQRVKFRMTEEEFRQAIQRFVASIAQQDSIGITTTIHEDFNNLEEFLAVLIDPSKSSSIILPGTTRLLKDELHRLLYRYSHQKFETFLELPEMRFVLHKVLNSEYIGTLISKSSKMSQYEGLYRKCAEKIIEKIEQIDRAL